MEEGTTDFGEFRGLDLQRVVIAPKQTDESVQILAIELYEDGVVVRWVRPGGFSVPESPEEAMLDPMGGGSMVLSDDRGTEYKLAGMHGGGGGSVARGETHSFPRLQLMLPGSR